MGEIICALLGAAVVIFAAVIISGILNLIFYWAAREERQERQKLKELLSKFREESGKE